MDAVGLRLKPEEGAFPGVDRALARTDRVTREALVNLEWLDDGSYVLLYDIHTDDPGTVERVLVEHEEVFKHDVFDTGDSGCYAFAHVAERPSLSVVLELVDEHALLLQRPFTFDPDGVAVTVIGDGPSLQRAFDALSDELPVEVAWTGPYEPEHDPIAARLTDRQREALEAAAELGFYESPRKASYDEIGSALGCAPSTANELLRRAEAALVAGILD